MFVREGPSAGRARADGFAPADRAALAGCGVVAMLVPDEAQWDLVDAHVRPLAPPGALLLFAHGFALAHGGVERVRADLDVALVGPLGPGTLLRSRFADGRGLPGLFAPVRNVTGAARDRALAYAAALRMTRAGLLETTLQEEVVSDLFAEQVVLTGGVVELMRGAWETLVESGVSEQVAYYSCVQELKQILDVVHAHGIAGMRERISGTARYGGITRGPRVVGADARLEMGRILAEIRSGSFARELADATGRGEAGAPAPPDARHPMEEAGRWVRRHLGEVDTPRGEP